MIDNSIILIFSIFIYFAIYAFRKEISKKLNVDDLPDQNRKIHKFPTPKTGSYSITIIILISLVLNYLLFFFMKNLIKY